LFSLSYLLFPIIVKLCGASMSFFSAADIVKAAQMGHWIYKNWFVRSSQAGKLLSAST
jgi:hypothetical protein